MADRERPKDPLQRFREWVDNAERELNDLLAERSARDDANKLRARFSELSLDAQKRVAELWGRTFHGMNLPTRDDVIALGKRIAEVESALARIEAELRRLARPAAEPIQSEASARVRVPRTRKPPTSVSSVGSARAGGSS